MYDRDIVLSESADSVAIYNRSPIVPGHSLVVPKKHYESLQEMGEYEISGFFVFARKATSQLLEAYSTKDFDWIIQEGVHAGQTIQHLHLHVIPRQENDLESPGAWFEHLTGTRVAVDSRARKHLSPEEMRDAASRIRLFQRDR